MSRSKFLLPLTAIFTFVIVSSCNKKEGCTDPNASNFDPDAEVNMGCIYENGSFNVELHMHQYLGAGEIESGSIYNINGVQTQLDIAEFYLSNIRLLDAAGNETPAQGVYLLIKPEVEEYDLGDFPAGNYTKIMFDVGIDSATNAGDPSSYPLDNPLGNQFPTMYWGPSFGYVFMRIDGVADMDGDGTPDIPAGEFEMHIGMNNYLASIEFDLPVTIGSTNENICHIAAHYDMFFTDVDLATDNTTHTTDNVPLTELLFGNIFTMFGPEF
ncbi:MAG: MbnP family protein [Chitinophagales bacterium]